MSSLVSVEMRTKLLNINISITDKIDIISSLINEFDTIRDKMRNDEIKLIKSGEMDKWRQLRKDAGLINNYIGELCTLKCNLLDKKEVIMEENFAKLEKWLNSI